MKKHGFSVHFCIILSILSAFAVRTYAAEPSTPSSSYITLDEIRADMDAYCLSVFSGMTVERFPLKILSVVRNQRAGQSMIVVIGTEERFQHAGTVHGCSGSPVFIDGRLAGALAAGWDGGLDSLYMVRPIQDMLEVGSVESPVSSSGAAASAFHFDLSKPLSWDSIYDQAMSQLQQRQTDSQMMMPLSCSLSSEVCEAFRQPLENMGLSPISAPVMLPTVEEATQFEEGGVLAVVLCGGDISIAATGTVTHIIGDQVYGFGHSFQGEGPTNLPMTAGIIHSVVASRVSSFKFSSPGPILGTLDFDQSFAVRGTIGKMPETFPLTIRIDRDNAPEPKIYNCYVARDRTYTPMILQMAVRGAAARQGELPAEHTVRYKGTIRLKGYEPLEIDDVSAESGTRELERMLYTISVLAMNNPYEEVPIESVDIAISIKTGSSNLADVEAVDVSRLRVKAGQTVSIATTLKSFRSERTTSVIDFNVPETLEPGKYKVQVIGGGNYQRFVSDMMPQRFMIYDADTLVAALQRVTKFHNDGLYAVMEVPTTGIVLQQHELPQLPPTKMLLMQDDKRLRPVAEYQDWTESRSKIDKIVQGGARIELIVE